MDESVHRCSAGAFHYQVRHRERGAEVELAGWRILQCRTVHDRNEFCTGHSAGGQLRTEQTADHSVADHDHAQSRTARHRPRIGSGSDSR